MKNPFAKEDGMPIKGKVQQFIEWEEQQERKRLEKLSPKDRKKQQSVNQSMQNKMES